MTLTVHRNAALKPPARSSWSGSRASRGKKKGTAALDPSRPYTRRPSPPFNPHCRVVSRRDCRVTVARSSQPKTSFLPSLFLCRALRPSSPAQLRIRGHVFGGFGDVVLFRRAVSKRLPGKPKVRVVLGVYRRGCQRAGLLKPVLQAHGDDGHLHLRHECCGEREAAGVHWPSGNDGGCVLRARGRVAKHLTLLQAGLRVAASRLFADAGVRVSPGGTRPAKSKRVFLLWIRMEENVSPCVRRQAGDGGGFAGEEIAPDVHHAQGRQCMPSTMSWGYSLDPALLL